READRGGARNRPREVGAPSGTRPLGNKSVQVSVVQVLVFAFRGLKRGLEGVEVEVELGLVWTAQFVHRPPDPHRRADLLALEISEATVSFRKCHPCLLRP